MLRIRVFTYVDETPKFEEVECESVAVCEVHGRIIGELASRIISICISAFNSTRSYWVK